MPRVIWSFWHNHTDLPRAVQLALASWRGFAPDHEIRLLDSDTWRDAVGPALQAGTRASPTTGDNRFADWLRVVLLEAHGGVWLDSTIILTAPIELLVNHSSPLCGVHLGRLFETSFIAAAPGARAMRLWSQEFQRIAAMDEAEYNSYLTSLKVRGIEPLNGAFADCDWANKSLRHTLMHALLQFGAAFANKFVRFTGFYVHPCGEYFWMHYLNLHVL